jgi:hypothetical protein
MIGMNKKSLHLHLLQYETFVNQIRLLDSIFKIYIQCFAAQIDKKFSLGLIVREGEVKWQYNALKIQWQGNL